MDIYNVPEEFWSDVGLVFKNCNYYNLNECSEIRIISDSLREITIKLYREWHESASNKYNNLLKSLRNKTLTPDFDGKLSQEVEDIKKSIEEEVI